MLVFWKLLLGVAVYYSPLKIKLCRLLKFEKKKIYFNFKNLLIYNYLKLQKHKVNEAREPNKVKFLARLDVFELAELDGSGKISIEISVGIFKVQSKKIKYEVVYKCNQSIFNNFFLKKTKRVVIVPFSNLLRNWS